MASSGVDKFDYTYSKIVVASGDKGLPGGTKTAFSMPMGPNMQKVKRVSVSSVTFPNNAYNINSTGGGINNTFAVQLLATVYGFNVEAGFWNTATLMTNVQSAINSAIVGVGGASVTLSQDPISQKVSIAFNAGASGATSLQIQDNLGASGVWEILGFSGLPLSVPAASSIIATNLPSLGGLHEVYLQSNALCPGNAFDATEQRNIQITIPVTAPFGAQNLFECKVDELCTIRYLTPRNLTVVDFTLTDKRGVVLDLHGGNLTINLKVWFDRY